MVGAGTAHSLFCFIQESDNLLRLTVGTFEEVVDKFTAG